MTDIVARLRSRYGGTGGTGLGPVCDEAADEIEQLRSTLALQQRSYEREREIDEEEIERLRTALGGLPEPAWFPPQSITEDAYSADQMRHEKAIGATEAMAQACNELSAALGWPLGISHGPLPWDELLRLVAQLMDNVRGNAHMTAAQEHANEQE